MWTTPKKSSHSEEDNFLESPILGAFNSPDSQISIDRQMDVTNVSFLLDEALNLDFRLEAAETDKRGNQHVELDKVAATKKVEEILDVKYQELQAAEETMRLTLQCTKSSRDCVRILTQNFQSQESFDALITRLEKLYDDELKLQDAVQKEEDLIKLYNDKLRKFQRHWDEARGDATSPEACYNDCVKLATREEEIIKHNLTKVKKVLHENEELKKQLLARRNRISNVVSGPGSENLLDIQSRYNELVLELNRYQVQLKDLEAANQALAGTAEGMQDNSDGMHRKFF
ncbi:hypothetical protein GUITHDRAFT_115851 [Guillardia theta CCMP2712]|uniref:Uncharacterized protein n=1 Tax=Guillardia theta (strain CCMP2712) TaxID=905079 RepID=L1IQC6_GUITC|nr:hypothetical protein GUITHDRAFT_115851 [Guillardia theta CCMP2712]EKX38089.1 hypothetical protein GUITHDRAFT_115851 [Guillardia theta CCMP2712]|eukprot:XP_005825069.1 hypothetical protein GUITHDRAFT_115851 [Guillardia theta CCMP2712]